MKICINIPINIKIRAYFVVKYHTFVLNCCKVTHYCGDRVVYATLLWQTVVTYHTYVVNIGKYR